MVRGDAARAAREAMRERLLSAAAVVVAEQGVAGTTTKAVARAAGVAEGSIYNHFADKTELLAAALVHRFPDLGAELAAAGDGPDALAGLHRIGMTALAFYERLLPIMSQVPFGSPLAHRVQALLDDRSHGPLVFRDQVAQLLEAGRDAGRFGLNGPAPIVAALFLGACREWAATRRHGVPPGWPAEPADFVDAVLATLLRS
ncbi:MAG TPA: helix-turn-helix domain-containing protein [Kineosporiaceae bacterium]|jgi:AcrR family transcriptional regulator|nr:helix-turn-helix domain-containing protein [Kineosporiaceae bacterium]